jgi:hypothetical protein
MMESSMSNKVLYLGLAFCVVVLTGCGRLIDWGKSRFYQGNSFKIDLDDIKEHIRWATVYDQFSTVATFDALWLSPAVRTAFAQEHAFREEKTEEHYKAALRRQLEEPSHFIAFYVLSLHEVGLGDPSSEWALFLTIDNQKLDPLEIKGIDLPYEYQMFFGKRLTLFKDTYSVKFDAKTIDEKLYLTPERHTMQLHFRKFDKEVTLEWRLADDGSIIPEKVSGGVPLLQSQDGIVKHAYKDVANE